MSSDDRVYDVAVTQSGVLTVATLDSAGKVTSTFSTKSGTLCGLKSVSADGHALRVIGDSCKGDHAALLSVDLASHAVSVSHSFANKLETVGFDGSSWIAVAKTNEHGSVFQRGAN